jgi:hypothetical protein
LVLNVVIPTFNFTFFEFSHPKLIGGTPKVSLLVVPSLGISFGSFKHDMAKPMIITAKIVLNSLIVTKPKAYTIP